MENEKMLTFELNIKFGLKDYRLKYITKKSWILALLIFGLKLLVILYNSS